MPDSLAPTISTSTCSFGEVVAIFRSDLPPSSPGFVPAIHVFDQIDSKDVDARHKAGHDEKSCFHSPSFQGKAQYL
jgi:hypothetical protein